MTRALIVGCRGQDGQFLTQHLEASGYEVTGLARDGLYRDGRRCQDAIPIGDRGAVAALLDDLRPAEVYHLAAHHHSSEEEQGDHGTLVEESFSVHVGSLFAFLEAIRVTVPSCRLFYAASSLVFGEPAATPQTEHMPIAPVCIYGITKAAGLNLCRYFRKTHGLFCSTGILYTHESPLRSPRFLSQRVVQTAAAIKRGEAEELVVGDLNAIVDWGWAPDYVDAMHRVMLLDTADDFIVASGQPSRISEFVDAVFDALSLSPHGRVREDPTRIIRNPPAVPLVGDITKLNRATGWRPIHAIEDIACLMVAATRCA